MDSTTGADSDKRPTRLREAWRRTKAKLRRWIPFASGIAAALLGVYLYTVLNPPPPPLTVEEVDAAVAQAMASATPAPAYSARVYSAIQPSLVLIQSAGVGESGSQTESLGTGVVITNRGEILTALHVVEDASAIQVVFADGTHASAEISAVQPENDIAVLAPGALPAVLVPAVMGNPNALNVGDEAYAVGNPFGLYSSISAGVISGFERVFYTDESTAIEGLIQIDAAVNPGNSGGPLLNRSGQVVGIVVGILNPIEEEFFVGIGFAVPITTAADAAGFDEGPQY